MRIPIVILTLLSLAAAETINLPEGKHGSVRLEFALPLEYGKQKVTLTWIDSNSAVKATRVEWYPTEWHQRYRAPLEAPEISWVYREYGPHRALAVAHFANGERIEYAFVVVVHEPHPVSACLLSTPEACQ